MLFGLLYCGHDITVYRVARRPTIRSGRNEIQCETACRRRPLPRSHRIYPFNNQRGAQVGRGDVLCTARYTFSPFNIFIFDLYESPNDAQTRGEIITLKKETGRYHTPSSLPRPTFNITLVSRLITFSCCDTLPFAASSQSMPLFVDAPKRDREQKGTDFRMPLSQPPLSTAPCRPFIPVSLGF